ncbi:unnamed protein product [Symbiodinium sp. CCMP2456]|nr:unnamed protein product [Symbiodinium sp. CCMP2456]
MALHRLGILWVDEKDEMDNARQHYVQRYVYRALRSDEDVMAGLRARDPAANRTIAQALQEGALANQFLHTTVSPEVALYYAEAVSKNSKQQVVEIDLEYFDGEVIDVSDPHGCKCHDISPGSKASNFAVKHGVVMLKGYIQPSRLGKVLSTAALRLDATAQRSLEGFLSALPERVRSKVKTYWRTDPARTRCRKPSEQEPSEQVCRDDAAQRLVLKRASEKLLQEIMELEARRALIDAQLQQIQEREDREARLKEEARVLKLEEERRERERQEEIKKRKQEKERAKKKHQAEDTRGPRVWAALSSNQKHLSETFDREALHVALGNDSYITLWDFAKGHAWCNIPKSLENKLNGRGYHQSHATMVALSPDSEAYYVKFSDGTAQWSGPGSFMEAVADYGILSVVAFGESGSWFAAWPDGSWQTHGLPRSLSNMLDSNRHRSIALLSISGTGYLQDVDEAAWFIHWGDNQHPAWKLTNAPSALSEKVNDVQEQWGTVRSIEFGSYGEWVLRWTPWT